MFIYLVKLQKDNYNVIKIFKTFKSIKFKDETNFKSLDELKKFLKNKKNLYFSIFSTNAIKTTMDIPKVVKGDSTIRLMIEAKFSKEMNLDKKEINYSFYKVDETKNSIRYNIDGVYESDYKEFYTIAIPKNVEVASLDIYSLYSLNRYFYKDKFFISLHISFTSLIIIAGDDKMLLFSRVLSIKENIDLNAIKDEIVKNILYIKQKTRLNYEIVTIGGAIINNTELLKEISGYVKIETINFTPSLIFKNIDIEIFNKYLIEFGTLVIDDNFNFIPLEFKSKKQFNQILNFYILILLLISSFVGYEIFQKSSEYFELKERYFILKTKLIDSFSKINIGNKESENFILSFLELISTNPNYILLSQIEAISSKLINFDIEFDTFNWISKNNSLSLSFGKKFGDLFALNEFVRQLQEEIVGVDSRIRVDIISNYENLNVKVNITIIGSFK